MVFVYKCKLLAIDDNTYREVKLHQGQCLNGCIPSVKINLCTIFKDNVSMHNSSVALRLASMHTV